MELERFATTEPVDALVGALDRDGAVVLRDFVDPGMAERLAHDFQTALDRVDWCNNEADHGDDFFGRRTKRLYGLVGIARDFEGVLMHPVVEAVCAAVLSPITRETVMSTSELMAIGGGEQAQALHRDGDSWLNVPRPHPELLVSINLAVTDFTADNGATVVVPGSHRWEAGRRAAEHEKTSAVMERGSALLYNGSVLHGGGASKAQETRIGMYVGFIPSWLRPIENIVTTTSRDVLDRLPAATQRRIGYAPSGFQVVL